MSDYVESGYSKNYVEGDTPSSVVSCDLTVVESELSSLRVENAQLKDSISVLQNTLDSIVSSISNLNTLTLSNQSKLVDLESKIDLVPTENVDISSLVTIDDISSLVTTDYIDNKVPFVDDKSLKIFPKGQSVFVNGLEGIFTVESSKFLPSGDFIYMVIYTVSKIIDGVKHYSDFANSYVMPIEPDDWIKKSDCPDAGA